MGPVDLFAVALLGAVFLVLWLWLKLKRVRFNYDNQLKKAREEINNISSARPVVETKKTKILTVGLSSAGKTSLTLQWARPVTHQQEVQSTDFCEVYDAPCSIRDLRAEGKIITKWFEIWDFGGEVFSDVIGQLHTKNFQALIFVVDLANNIKEDESKLSAQKEATNVSEMDLQRVKEQLDFFTPSMLRVYLASTELRQKIKSVILFINKVDLFSSMPQGQVEAAARTVYRRLIDPLEEIFEKAHVVIGSAKTGLGTQEVFAHLRRELLETEDHVNPRPISPNEVIAGMLPDKEEN